MESQENILQMIRESAKVTAYAVEWFTDKFSPTQAEIEKAKQNAKQTYDLISCLENMRNGVTDVAE